LTNGETDRKDADGTRELVAELAQLRDLDRLRNAHPPGTPEHDAESKAVEALSQRVMNHFRDDRWRQPRRDGTPDPKG
jgi:hypothetical protein